MAKNLFGDTVHNWKNEWNDMPELRIPEGVNNYGMTLIEEK